ncbi:MAG TPA: T9SS type A sorting domain-containing protein [Bacteroidia bacterium]|jgi:hypothetical protein|nr:T9SS type A sorting domain-containing protein [Bacteroidia bacterium]
MKKITFFLLHFLFFGFLANAQQWSWVKNISYSFNNPSGSCLASDNNSNFYESTNFTSSGSCIAKFDGQGNELWRQYLTGGVVINGITCRSNYVYITGSFSSTLQVGTVNLTSYGGQDAFVACLTSNGNFVWANNYGGSTNDFGNGICSDIKGNIYLTGGYSGTANFGTSNLVCHGSSTMFMAKLNSFGNILLLKTAATQDTTAYGSNGSKIKTDISGNIFITGRFSDMLLDTFHVVGYGSYFLCRLDSFGNTKWVEATGDDYHPSFDFTLDYSGNIILTGEDDWNHGSNTMMQKYNPHGQLIWDSGTGCGYWGQWGLKGIATDGFNSSVVGYGECSYLTNYYQANNNYLLLAKYDSSGAIIFLDTIAGNATGESIIRDSNGDFIISGVIEGSLKLGNDLLSTTVRKVFIAKFNTGNSGAVVPNFKNPGEITIYPNPSAGVFTVRAHTNNSETKIYIYDLLGNRILNKVSNNLSSRIDLSNQPKGIYFVEMISGNEKQTKKIIIE